MAVVKRILPYLILSVLIIVSWKFSTLTDKYAWDPEGIELQMLEIALTTIFLFKVIFWLIVGNSALFAFISYLNGRKNIAVISALVAAVMYFFGGHFVNRELAHSYFVIFQNQSVSEEYIDRPILESGYYIGPELTDYIQKRSAKGRRYAINGLGKIGYEPAIPALVVILVDTNEPNFIRADAFDALASIGTKDAERAIREFEEKGGREFLDSARDE